MGQHFNHERFHNLLAIFRHGGQVEHCLHYPGMAEVPAGYNRYAWLDAQTHDIEWDDLCPAYALALVTHDGYTLPQDDGQMEILWDELGGSSTKLWPQVREVVSDAWTWLDRQQDRDQQNN